MKDETLPHNEKDLSNNLSVKVHLVECSEGLEKIEKDLMS
jgi:hypothetical protein